MSYAYFVGFMRRFGSVITYFQVLNPGHIGFCGYLLGAKPHSYVEKEKKCRKYQGKF
jgi:hypothetical protein